MASWICCSSCSGTGQEKCTRCNGTGKVYGRVNPFKLYTCSECGGTGKVECSTCRGFGLVEVEDEDG